MRVLGVDLGLKRTGLAVSDELGLTARALPTLTPRSRAEDVQFLVEQIEQLEVSDVVIGLASLPRSGDVGPMAKRAQGFAAALEGALRQAALDVTVHLVDESYSSKRASERLVESGVKRSKRKEALDGEVARGLVLDFIASQGAQAARAARDARGDP
jgi:putative Holliday junction resolvase